MSFECWVFFHFIWSHRIAASLGDCSLHPIVTAVCVIPSHPISCLLSLAQLFSAGHTYSHLFSRYLISSADRSSSSQLFCGPKPAHKTDLGAKASDPFPFHAEDLTEKNFYTQQAFYTETRSKRCFYTQEAFTHGSFAHRSHYTEKLSHRGDFTHWSFYTQKFLHRASLHTEKLLHTDARSNLLYREAFAHSKLLHRSFCTLQTFTEISFYTQRLLHREAFKLLHTEAFTQRSFQAFRHRSFYSQKLLHTASLFSNKLLHRGAFTHWSLCIPQAFIQKKNCANNELYSQQAFTQQSKLLHTAISYTQQLSKPLYTQDKICWHHSSLLQPWCSHFNAIYDVQLQKTLVLCT